MHSKIRAIVAYAALLCGALTAGCGEDTFPITPAPTALTPVTTLQGANYQGTIVEAAGQEIPFNMTLIARGVGLTTSQPAHIAVRNVIRSGQQQLDAQTPGTTIVTGNFETGAGVTGTIQGNLEGTLENGTLDAMLGATTGGCTEQRRYTGAVSGSGIALIPHEVVQSCPTNVLTFTVQTGRPGGPSCTFSISPTTIPVSGGGGTTRVTVTTASGCVWAAEALSSWLAIEGSLTGTGPATLTVRVESNEGTARQGTLRIAGKTLTINQGPRCTYAINRSSARFEADGGNGTLTVNAPDLCEWSAQSQAEWLTVSPSSGNGTGTVRFAVAVNRGQQREGRALIAGQTFTVTQDRAPTTGTLTGTITSADNGQPIANATVRVATRQTTTNASGVYTLTDAPAGSRTVETSAPPLFSSRTDEVTIAAGATTTFSTSLVPVGGGGDITIVLNWGAQPVDLDSHLTGPSTSGGRFHLFFEAPNPVPYATLDVDDTTGFGPETVTVSPVNGIFVPGSYSYYVDNFSEDPGFEVSGAVIAVFQSGVQIGRFPVSAAAGSPASLTWSVFNFTLTATATGGIAITPVQQFSTSQPASVRGIRKRK